MPTDKKRIQAYVSPTTYQMIQGHAEAEGISVSEAAARILNTYLGDSSTISQVDMSQYITRQEFEAKIAAVLTQMGHIEGSNQAFFSVMQDFWVDGMERLSQGKSLKEGKKYQALKGR